jgi:hypothetical protein
MAQRFAQWKAACGIPQASRSVSGYRHHPLIIRAERGIKNFMIVLHGRGKRFPGDSIPNPRSVISRSRHQPETIMTESYRMHGSKVTQSLPDRLSGACVPDPRGIIL